MANSSLLPNNPISHGQSKLDSLDLKSFELLLCEIFTDFESSSTGDNEGEKEKKDHIRYLFDLFDQDKDGSLNESEIKFMWSNWIEKLQSDLKFALVIVDMQNDFICGSLVVPGAKNCIPVINQLISKMNLFDKLIYTFDWHPANHISFFENVNSYRVEEINGKKQFNREAIRMFDQVKIRLNNETVVEQILWPVHCVCDSEGAKLHKDLIFVDDARSVIILKGSSKDFDSYSAFFDNLKANKTGLDEKLKDIDVLLVTGVALEYCVGETVRDALDLGYATILVEDACRGIAEKSTEQTKLELQRKGCIFLNSDKVESISKMKKKKFQIGLQLAKRLFL